jgi:hypothetical protein
MNLTIAQIVLALFYTATLLITGCRPNPGPLPDATHPPATASTTTPVSTRVPTVTPRPTLTPSPTPGPYADRIVGRWHYVVPDGRGQMRIEFFNDGLYSQEVDISNLCEFLPFQLPGLCPYPFHLSTADSYGFVEPDRVRLFNFVGLELENVASLTSENAPQQVIAAYHIAQLDETILVLEKDGQQFRLERTE